MAIVRIVKAAVERIGLDSSNYAGHSLRAGLATSADLQRAALHDIMRQGRWRTVESARRYTRDNDIWRDNVTEILFRRNAALLEQASEDEGQQLISSASTPGDVEESLHASRSDHSGE